MFFLGEYIVIAPLEPRVGSTSEEPRPGLTTIPYKLDESKFSKEFMAKHPNYLVFLKHLDPSDQFTPAFAMLPISTRFFGAPRPEKGKVHDGGDFFTRVDTPVQGQPTMVLIGICDGKRFGTAKAYNEGGLGNALAFFIPIKTKNEKGEYEFDPKASYFLILEHLSSKTFKLLKDKGYGIGSVIQTKIGEDNVIAYTGDTMAGERAHLHVTTSTEFRFGKTDWANSDFLAMYSKGTITDFLEGTAEGKDSKARKRNFFAILPHARTKDPTSLAGLEDPMTFIERGQLRISSLPLQERIAKAEKLPEQKLLVLK